MFESQHQQQDAAKLVVDGLVFTLVLIPSPVVQQGTKRLEDLFCCAEEQDYIQ